MDRTPLSYRPLDRLWFLWFVASLCIPVARIGTALMMILLDLAADSHCKRFCPDNRLFVRLRIDIPAPFFSQPLTALIDGQAIYPRHLVPGSIRSLYLQALEFSKDTLMLGMERQDPSLFWFKGL
jgi:hypothetical protein